eukprot:TRINITY_DN2240_c0_g1_i1.p1 TRINITY_DN2240_c0_g1~~TRINITY_DN2240_c0_g1_i1.p1  ORF type:complete len:297 (-),score=32.87 TRINITY_DN2240_c0_g1_i1:77-967(-)
MELWHQAVTVLQQWEWDPPHTPLSTWSSPLMGTVTYIIVIAGLKVFMRNRKSMNILGIQVVYNAAMVALSAFMFVGIILAAIARAQDMGPMSLICEPTDEPLSGVFGFLIYLFYVSKYVELFDTVQLVLKKKRTIPLHLFHHIAMLSVPFSWLDGSWVVGSWWCVMVNSLVHTFMYYYYLRAALGHYVWWKKYLTQGQIIQFLTGFILVSYWFWIRTEQQCKGGLLPAVISHAGNLVLIVMFVRFFISTYGQVDDSPSTPPTTPGSKKPTAATFSSSSNQPKTTTTTTTTNKVKHQ